MSSDVRTLRENEDTALENLVLYALASRLGRQEQAVFRGARIQSSENEGVEDADQRESAERNYAGPLRCKFGAAEKEAMRRQIEQWMGAGYGLLTLSNRSYPPLLKESFEPPLILFYRGRLPEKWDGLLPVSIVGTRRPDAAGIETAHVFATACAKRGLSVVSGLAMGVDAAAHRGALEGTAECTTVAVLGHGLDMRYPAINEGLYERILEGNGLLLSQYEPSEKPFPARFLERNRIIAGMSKGVVVIQAGSRSGSLVTARYALEEGRDVMVVPGGIQDPRYGGSNSLIKDGAYLVRSPEDVFEVLGVSPLPSNEQTPQLRIACSEAQKKILEMLNETEHCHYDVLASVLESRSAFAHEMLQLELHGLITRRPGNYFTLAMKIG